jgi:hypothetical protein
MDAEPDRQHLRVATFVVPRTWHEIDRSLRACEPAYVAQAGTVMTRLGRRGSGPTEERVLASVWTSRRAHDQATDMIELMSASGAGPMSLAWDRIDQLPVRIHEVFERDRPMTILRVFHGRTHPGELEVYLEEARAGTMLDGASPDGPGALICASDDDATFVTVSLWPDWSAIEACTGGDIQRPLATRNATRIAQGAPTHYEIIPTVASGRDGDPPAGPG